MNQKNPQPFLIAIVGPTASGKSVLGVWLAERFGGEVVACESTQLYRGFDIGTAKPRVEERRGIVHHLIDVLDPSENATAGGYRELALAVLQDLRQRERLPVLTVGTGLYLRALLEGLAEIPQRSEKLRERLRNAAKEHPLGYLHRILKRLDAQAATKTASADEQKLIRAIEVCLLTRRPISEVHRAGRKPLEGWHVVKIGLMPPREELYERIHARTSSMLECGWMQEVQNLLHSGLSENAKPFDFIGYRELRSLLRKELSLQQAREAIQQATRRYAKRQLTWFRREAAVQWFSGFGDDEKLQSSVLVFLQFQGIEAGRGARKRGV
jgi:tRNA dimethylallyltransferase